MSRLTKLRRRAVPEGPKARYDTRTTSKGRPTQKRKMQASARVRMPRCSSLPHAIVGCTRSKYTPPSYSMQSRSWKQTRETSG